MKPATPGQPSQRQLRVGELIRHALADILQRGEVHDPALEGMVVTVPEVRMSPDFQARHRFRHAARRQGRRCRGRGLRAEQEIPPRRDRASR